MIGDRLVAKIPTAAGELLLALVELREVVAHLAAATGQSKDPAVDQGFSEVDRYLRSAEELLVEKLPDLRAAGS